MLDRMKDLGLYYSTRSGLTVGVSDIIVLPEKEELLDEAQEKVEAVLRSFRRGLITDGERHERVISIWSDVKDVIQERLMDSLDKMNPNYMNSDSGSRGNPSNFTQLAGMRGLMANPAGRIIELPMKSSFREGLTVLEYFISTHGARKGLADTALRTADSGYLTRRLGDVSQDVIVREEDCGTTRGLVLPVAEKGADGVVRKLDSVDTSIRSRIIAQDVEVDGEVLIAAGTEIGDVVIRQLVESEQTDVRVRSVLTCESKVGTCALCYGQSLATGTLDDISEAVGIIAAQSIGEPAPQWTMRTFHNGGVATSEDLSQGLPRVQELWEARTPNGVAPSTEVAGRVAIEDAERGRRVVVTPDDGSEERVYPVSRRARLLLEDGDHVEVGQQLVQGSVDPKQVLRILGPRAAQKYLVDEVQQVYASQGVDIHDKHIEVIVRQMLRRITIIDSD